MAQSLSFGASYSIYIPYQLSLHCAPWRCPTGEPRQLLPPRRYALALLQRIGGIASSPIYSKKRNHHLKGMSPERGDMWHPGRHSQADTQ